MSRIIKILLLIVVVYAVFSCRKPPEYDVVPKITFVSIDKEILIEGPAKTDVITIAIRFEDGDGDLGITDEMAKADPKKYNNDTINNDAKHSNFLLSLYKLVAPGEYELVKTDLFNINGRFEPLMDVESVGPIDGVLRHTFNFRHASVLQSGLLQQNERVIFEISILDRKMNQSNTVRTTEIIIIED